MNRLTSALALAAAFSPFLIGCAADIGDADDPGLVIEEDYNSWDPCSDESCMEPIIWLHGCPVPQTNAEAASHFSDAQRQYFLDRGYPSNYLYRFVFSGAQCDSNIAYAQQIANIVSQVRAATGARRVNIVAHSMGALAARLYIAFGGYRYVRDFVSIAGANHGSQTAVQGDAWQDQFGYPAFEGAKEMYPPYACKYETSNGESADVQYWVNGCLKSWGRTAWVDETPHGDEVDYLSIWNTTDEMVIPQQSACINQWRQNDCGSSVNHAVTVPPGPGPCGPTGCPGHIAMMWDPGVMQQVFDFIDN